MAVDSKLLDNGKGLGIYGRGRLTGDELRNHVEHESLPAVRKHKYLYILCDFSGVNEPNISPDAIEAIIHQNQRLSKARHNGFIAVVAPQNLLFGFSRMWEARTSDVPWEKMVFRSAGEARDWLKERIRDAFDVDARFEIDGSVFDGCSLLGGPV